MEPASSLLPSGPQALHLLNYPETSAPPSSQSCCGNQKSARLGRCFPGTAALDRGRGLFGKGPVQRARTWSCVCARTHGTGAQTHQIHRFPHLPWEVICRGEPGSPKTSSSRTKGRDQLVEGEETGLPEITKEACQKRGSDSISFRKHFLRTLSPGQDRRPSSLLPQCYHAVR